MNSNEQSANLAAIQLQNLQAYLGQMVQLIHQDGLAFLNNKRRRFSQVESLDALPEPCCTLRDRGTIHRRPTCSTWPSALAPNTGLSRPSRWKG
jgi:hypothetical protein